MLYLSKWKKTKVTMTLLPFDMAANSLFGLMWANVTPGKISLKSILLSFKFELIELYKKKLN